jgi:hypothetical protein
MIKHLKPRSKEEIRDMIFSEPVITRMILSKKFNIKLTKEEIKEAKKAIKIHFKNGIDDKKFEELINKNKLIVNKEFKLKHDHYLYDMHIDKCCFELWEDANIILLGECQISNCIFKSIF